MDDAAEGMAIAMRFATLARKNDPNDYEVVIHTAYYAMHHAARAALLAARGSAPTNHGRVSAAFMKLASRRDADRGPQRSRALRAAYDLRLLSDYGRAGRDLSGDAAQLLHELDSFLEYCHEIVAAHQSEGP